MLPRNSAAAVVGAEVVLCRRSLTTLLTDAADALVAEPHPNLATDTGLRSPRSPLTKTHSCPQPGTTPKGPALPDVLRDTRFRCAVAGSYIGSKLYTGWTTNVMKSIAILEHYLVTVQVLRRTTTI